ncbi:AIPR family protein [Faecalibacterium prausnitzii]|uniref:AIPR family protein n=1 Tax=Faecalibacterium prausnitzii TaxID=853 RepID=UPI00130D738C|nr:AIPR family protein [Faecalibacterium prausnitzii]
MVNDKILEFYKEFQDEVLTYVKENSPISTNTAFKTLFLSYLTEAGETLVSDCMLVDFKKDSENMKLDGYAFSEYFRSLTLLVSKYQAKPNPEKIKKTEIDKLRKKVLKFYKTCGTNDFEALEESSDGYQAYKFIKGHKADIETVNIILLTNDETIRYIPDDVHYGKITVRFDVWDIERLYQSVLGGTAVERQLVIKLKKKYGGSLPLIKVKGDNEIYDCYIGVISGELLARIYETEGQDLIQKNVRSFLQAIGKVNKGIKVSLANEPQMFMAYNNGISTIAESIAIDESRSNGDIVNITEITGWQIVNGGQTTASIYNAYKAKLPLEQVNVQIKLSVIKQKDRAEEIIHNISKYANSQNKINMSDFNANDAYHVKMERLSRATPIPVAKGKSTDYWFYERARGQYLVELNRQPTAAAKKEFKSRCPKNRCISKTVAAKCVMTYRGYPDIVSKGLETSFIYFSDMVSKGEVPEPSEQSYIEMIAKVILFNSCDEIIKNLKFGGFKAQQDYYTVALFGKYYSDLFNPLEIWNRQSINAETAKTIEELAYFVWNHFQNPTVPGVNIGQWCKKEECWELLQARYENEYKQG